MTKLEASLLDILKEDCRIPLEKLAVMTGTSMEEVAAAIEDLENRKIILSQHITLLFYNISFCMTRILKMKYKKALE